ncbi:SDR family oxidoreductase [Streptomyces sp. NPDC021020]|uniref:SDR family oxidoreductase n=1 Tax=Streptomyces sp. NPDC021020 TaxID=3365109 RepID=UPI00379EF7CB
MPVSELAGSTAVVTGAGRGFGRGVAAELIRAGARVLGLARDREALEKARADLGDAFVPVPGDATDPGLAADLLARHAPRTVVLAAGATPAMLPLQDHTWETFSAAWDTDVRHVFGWSRAALRQPLPPGSTVVAFSSGAALRGSPLSGGYAGAKAAVRFVAAYADGQSRRHGLGIRFTALLPSLAPTTDLGVGAAAAYAAYEGITTEAFVDRMGPLLTPQAAGAAVLELARGQRTDALAYGLSADGLTPLAD